MAMITCKECGKKVSDMAKACTECGFPVSEYVAYEAAVKAASDLTQGIHKIAIRPDTPGGNELISGSYGDLEIIVKSHLTTTELIVNGIVCGERKGFFNKSGFSIDVNICGIFITAKISFTGASKLLINGSLLTTGTRRLR